jgi:CRISPR/Cas system-associated protein endoribonuclease Cas2
MKLSFSEKFLWGLYNIGEKIDDINEIFRITTFREVVIDQSFWRDLQKKKDKKQFAQFINYLKKKGYIKTNAKKGILITPKGKGKVLKIKYKFLEKKKRKDGKWIMLMYDIPVNRNRERHLFRRQLQYLGYQQLQKSIWVCPYDVFKETEKIINLMSLSDFMRTFLIEEIKILR